MASASQVVRVLRRTRRIPRAQWVAWWRNRPVEPDVVLYEAGQGAGLLDSPYAIFRALIEDPEMSHLHHVWVVADPERRERARDHVQSLGVDASRVSFVRYRSPGYFRHLATAGYLVNSATFPAELSKRPGQTYLNTWHGTPLKSMGYDTPGGALDAANIIRNFLIADHLLSSGPYMTDTMYRGAYRLEGLAPGTVLEAGVPRTDVQLTADERRRAEIRDRLALQGVALDPGRQIALVAPTWRGTSFADPRLDVATVLALVTTLREELGEGWQVVAKVHPVVHDQAKGDPAFAGLLVPADLPANDVLAVADHLVTDYSSILFDALADARLPVTFYLPDQEDYEQSRPLYIPADDLPGRVCRTPLEVAQDVSEGGTRADVRSQWAARYAPFDDGQATRRVIDAVWRGRQPDRGRTVAIAERVHAGRRVPRVLIHAGSLQRNGVTSSLIALLRHIDLDRVDVSVTWGPARDADPKGFVAAIDPRIRLLPRVGGLNGPKRVVWSRRLLEALGPDSRVVPMPALVDMLRDEWLRCYGSAQLDHVIDFGGYAPYWALLMSRGVAPGEVRTHSMWLHNDMAAEVASAARKGNSRAGQLEQVFGLYRRFDRLVSVSPALSEINERSLGAIAGGAQFRSARNLIDEARVRVLAEVALADLGLPEAVVTALEDPATPTFVTAGRLTMEKNQARLVRAAAALRDAGHPFAVVIMGTGPTGPELRALIDELDLTGTVHLVGHQANPFPIVAAADCFVLTSEHEGLPMVILEALALGTPVITTAFSSVDGVVPPGCGVVVEHEDDAVARAMIDLVSERPAFGSLDVDAYNGAALADFAAAIGLLDESETPSPPRPEGPR